MGNQLAATATVDLANVSSDLELIAPLGAEGRNYFATFHCLAYTPVASNAANPTTSANGAVPSQTSPPPSSAIQTPSPALTALPDNAPGYATDFFTADGHNRRSEYRPNSLYYPSTNTTAAPLSSSTANRGMSRGRGRGGMVNSFAAAAAASSAPTTHIAAHDRAAWHQARWQQRLPVAGHPWRVGSSSFPSEATAATSPNERSSAGEAMDRWCRDSTASSAAFAHGASTTRWDAPGGTRGGSANGVDGRLSSPAPPTSSPQAVSSPLGSAVSFYPRGGTAATTSANGGSYYASGGGGGVASPGTDIDATVAGVVGEWRGNYGNYVQLLLRGGMSQSTVANSNNSSGNSNTNNGGSGGFQGGGLAAPASAALCDGQVVHVMAPARSATAAATGVGYGARNAFTAAMTMTMPSALTAASNLGVNSNTTLNGINSSSGYGSPTAATVLQSYVMHDVVTKVFVRTQDDPGQSYFLKRVRQIMENAGEQLAVVDSTLPPHTPRNCLWYSLVYEGDGFCVLQRPYVAFTLRERLAARPGWTAQEKLFVAFQILQAVAHLHETYGLTHGDIKPNNVLVQSTGFVVLCDMAPFKPWRLPLDSPLLFDYYYDTDESRACYVAPEKFSDQPLPSPPLESKTPGSATYNVGNLNFDGHTASMDVFSTACVLLFIYREEDPFTLSEILNLHHLPTAEAREKVVLPVLQASGVPATLWPLLQSMLCNTSAERPSARELLTRGLETNVFPACFSFLYADAWPRLLTQPPDARLRLFQNQLDTIVLRCVELDIAASSANDRDCDETHKRLAEKLRKETGQRSCAAAVRVLLPLLLQTIHSTKTSDEATFRGVLCLRQCVLFCTFDALTDFILPHLVYLVNNDAHVYGPPTRLVALRLLCCVAETIARYLTACGGANGCTDALLSSYAEQRTSSSLPDEEQWALMEHLVLPCLYDLLRQGEQESTAVLVELAERLPRLLLLTRYLTERRQVLYGAEKDSAATSATTHPLRHETNTPAAAKRVTQSAVKEVDGSTNDTGAQVEVNKLKDESAVEEPRKLTTHVPAETQRVSNGGAATPPDSKPLTAGSTGELDRDATSGQTSGTSSAVQPPRENDKKSTVNSATPPAAPVAPVTRDEAASLPPARGGSLVGTTQYLAQLRCLLRNGWGMLQLLYNHSCVVVAAAMMRQTTSTVAAFLGEECVTEELIPLLTTSLNAPLRVLRLLFPQAILLHALLQRPHGKTLRLFVEEGLRHRDDVCLKATLDSVAVVVRSRKLPVPETMALVHQSLPFLMDARLWLREAACGVVEAAAQTYPPSAVALHLEYAVRPLLTHPVPLSQLRRFAASIIRSELAAPSLTAGRASAALHGSRDMSNFISFQIDGRRGDEDNKGTGWTPFSLDGDYRGDCHSAEADAVPSCSFLDVTSLPNGRATAGAATWQGDYRDALPSVVSAATTSTNLAAAPALLHLLPPAGQTAAAAATTESSAMTSHDEMTKTATSLTYKLAARESARVRGEGTDANAFIALAEATRELASACAASAVAAASVSSPPTSTIASRASAFTSLALQGPSHISVEPPHVVELSPLPRTLPPHASLCRTEVPIMTASAHDTSANLFFGSPSSPPPPTASSPSAAHVTDKSTTGKDPAAAVAVVANRMSTTSNAGARADAASPPSSSNFFPPSVSSSTWRGQSVSAARGFSGSVSTTRYAALRPTAAPLSSVSAHMGAIYTAAAAPSSSAVVVTAGTRGEAKVWRVDAVHHDAMHTRELTLLERVPLPDATTTTMTKAFSSENETGSSAYYRSAAFSYVASQWMDGAVLSRRDMNGSSGYGSSGSGAAGLGSTASATTSASSCTVALAATDGVVRVLDVERNAWVWSSAVGAGAEGAPTGLALQDRRCLLVTTAAGGLHVVDTRCPGHGAEWRSAHSDGGGAAAQGSVWRARLDPLDGPPSCLLPLYMGDRASAAVVGTYGGVVCLYDLRFQLCAQRTVMTAADAASSAFTASDSSPTVSITCGCVDPVSSLCRSCRPTSWEAAVPGPSMLFGTTAGTVYRVLLQSNVLGAYWPAFQSDAEQPARSVRCMLAQPSKGSVFTGGEDGYIRHWSTDRPETSHTVSCLPFSSPAYAVTRWGLSDGRADGSSTNNSIASGAGSGTSVAAQYGVKRLALLAVREIGGRGKGGGRLALPHHAADAILTLCAVQTGAAATASTWSGVGDGHSYLLSGARDGTLTLWDNVE